MRCKGQSGTRPSKRPLSVGGGSGEHPTLDPHVLPVCCERVQSFFPEFREITQFARGDLTSSVVKREQFLGAYSHLTFIPAAYKLMNVRGISSLYARV